MSLLTPSSVIFLYLIVSNSILIGHLSHSEDWFLEFPVPKGILIIPITPCTFPVTFSHLLYMSPVPLSAPVIPCAYPLSSLAFVRHHLCTYCHLKFSPVTPCTCLYHPCFPLHPLYGLCLLSEVCDAYYTQGVLLSKIMKLKSSIKNSFNKRIFL